MSTLSDTQKERFQNMEPFLSVDDIPELPVVPDYNEYKTYIINNLIRCGAIPKNQLEKGWYEGSCRNSSKAYWDGSKFIYERHKWGTKYWDDIKHFEDDQYHDVFIPLNKIN